MSVATCGAGLAVDGAAGGGGFDPVSLGPHVLLDPDEFGLTDGAAVATAVDSSGNGRDFTQGTAGSRPTLRGGAGLLNGHFVVEHDGTDDYLSGPNLSALTSAHVFMVVKVDNDPPGAVGQSGLWRMSASADATHFPLTDGNIYESAGSTSRRAVGNPAASLASWRVYEVRSAANDWSVKLDGTSLATDATNTVGFAAAAVEIGRTTGVQSFLDGRWAWFGLFAALSAGDADDVRAYLVDRFAL